MTIAKRRPRIGIIFNFNKNWLGGIYYIINIIKALNFLDEEDKPKIIVFYNKDLTKFTKEIQYPYLKLVRWNFLSTYKGFFQSTFCRKNLFASNILDKYDLDGIYPLNDFPQPIYQNSKREKVVVVPWFADLQHKFYPSFFTKITLIKRDLRIRFILQNSQYLVVSSDSVKSHFYRFFKVKKKINIHVLKFVSIIDNFSFEPFEELKYKYQISKKYFIISNQFHKHKNHLVVLRALAHLKSKGKKIHLVITGKMKNVGNQPYLDKLKSIIEINHLEDQIHMLGVIPRHDQLGLMKYSQAVIQPSLFEGWSTVIEDAKSLQLQVIASNIDVNIEQLKDKGIFFDPYDHEQLAEKLISFSSLHDEEIYPSYEKRVKQFAQKFISIFYDQNQLC